MGDLIKIILKDLKVELLDKLDSNFLRKQCGKCKML